MGLEEIDLAEFSRCRDEIDSQTELSARMILAEIALLAAGAALIEKSHYDALLALAALSSLLWVFWAGHTLAISKLGGYIACRLAPRLRRLTGERVLAWEEYSRITHVGGPKTYLIPYSQPKATSPPSFFHKSISLFVSFWFGAMTPVLLLIYGVIAIKQRGHTNHLIAWNLCDLGSDIRILAIIFVVLIWIAALQRFRSAKKSWDLITEDILGQAKIP
jgi:hypothetical protein